MRIDKKIYQMFSKNTTFSKHFGFGLSIRSSTCPNLAKEQESHSNFICSLKADDEFSLSDATQISYSNANRTNHPNSNTDG